MRYVRVVIVEPAKHKTVFNPVECLMDFQFGILCRQPEIDGFGIAVEHIERCARAQGIRRAVKRRSQEVPELAIRHVVVLNRKTVTALQSNVIRRVNQIEVGFRFAHQFGNVLRLRGISAQEQMFAQPIDHAANALRLFRHFRHGIRFGFAVLNCIGIRSIQQPIQFIGLESEKRQVEIRILQFLDFQRQKVVIPFRYFRCLVVGDAVRLNLFRREVCRHMDWHFRQPKFLRGFPSGVSAHDDVVFVDHNRRAPAEFRKYAPSEPHGEEECKRPAFR